MSEQTTEQLVHELAQGAPPVRPIPRLRRVMAGIVLAWGIAVALMWLLAPPPPPDWLGGAAWGDPKFLAILIGMGCVAMGATLAALAGAVPGRDDVATASGGVALAGMALAAGGGLWALLGTAVPPGDPGIASGLPCLGRAWSLGMLPVLVASLFLARGCAHRPILSAGFAVTGSVALGALVVHASCRMGGALHVLLGHALAPLLLGVVLAIPIGLLVRHWNRRA